MSLANQTALVTGGGSGIGLGVALALAREGCRVAIAGRDENRLREAAGSFSGQPAICFHACDVSQRDDVDRLFTWFGEQLGPIDILVNSAGVNVRQRRMAELSPQDWQRIIDINTTGTFHCMQAALEVMRPRRNGLIVNIASIAGRRALRLAGPAYCASKFAVSALTTAASSEERPNGIRITAVHPGEVNTPILAQRPEPVPPERLAQMLQPEDIGACVVMIAKLPPRAIVPELVITPMYQDFV